MDRSTLGHPVDLKGGVYIAPDLGNLRTIHCPDKLLLLIFGKRQSLDGSWEEEASQQG